MSRLWTDFGAAHGRRGAGSEETKLRAEPGSTLGSKGRPFRGGTLVPAHVRDRDTERGHHRSAVVPDGRRNAGDVRVGLPGFEGHIRGTDLVKFIRQHVRLGDAAGGELCQALAQEAVAVGFRQMRQQDFAHGRAAGGNPPAHPGDHPHGLGAVDLADVDDVGSFKNADMHRFIALSGDGLRDSQANGMQVQSFGEGVAEPEDAEPQMVGGGGVVPSEVPALGQRSEELVDSSPGKPGPLNDLGSRQSVAGIQEEFQNIETPKDRGSQTCHSNTLSRPAELPGPKLIVQCRFEISHKERTLPFRQLCRNVTPSPRQSTPGAPGPPKGIVQ